jgi:hypothetical protein
MLSFPGSLRGCLHRPSSIVNCHRPPKWRLGVAERGKFLASFLLLLLASCAPGPVPAAPAGTSATPLPSLIPASPAIATDLPTPTATATAIPAPSRAQYTLNVVLDYAARSAAVDETIVYPNHTGQSLSDLLLAVEPNFWQGCFTLQGLSLNDTAVTNYTLDSQKLSFPLDQPLLPEAVVTLKVQYALALPKIEPTDPNLSRPRIFGYSDRQINLTNWYPFVVPYINGQWVLHDPWYYGEHLVYDLADYVVNVRPADPAVRPIIASSGAPSQNGDWTSYTLTGGRTFALSASTEWLTETTSVGDVAVTSYYLGLLYQSSARNAANAAAQALQIYSDRFGPYPHKTLAVVMGDFNDDMEFSAFFFLSRDFYNLYDGTQKSYLIFVAAHETAHQWWFEQVANDQALQPWLDESLATYCEHIFYEGTNPSLVPWWWMYRIDYYEPQGFVDIPVYAGNGFRPYTNAVYFRGAHFLDDLRQRIGDDAFFAFLKDYLAQQNGKIAAAPDFFRILASHTTADYSDLVRKYFQSVY